jgi:hypothetical protein
MTGLSLPLRIRRVYNEPIACVRGDASPNQQLEKRMTTNDLQRQATDGVRFELTVRFHVHTLSRQCTEQGNTGTTAPQNDLAQHACGSIAPKRSRNSHVCVYSAYTALRPDRRNLTLRRSAWMLSGGAN